MELINEAYLVETGNSGVSFKNATRCEEIGEIESYLHCFYILKHEPNQQIIGVVKANIIDDGKIVDIGPFAVDPAFQVKLAKYF